MKNKVFIYISLFVLLFGCGEPFHDDAKDPGEKGNPGPAEITGTVDLVLPVQYEQKDIVVKVPDTVSLSEIDTVVPGDRIRVVTVFNGHKYVLYKTNGQFEAERIVEMIKGNALVKGAELDNVYRIFAVPNDTYYAGYQYAPQVTNCEGAWDVSTGNSSLTVAVVDTGINGLHSELAGRVIAGYDYVSVTAISANSNSDDNGHGTHCAGIIGAAGNNGSGIAGVVWNVKLMPVKVLDSAGSGSNSQITAGIVYAVANGADVISMSLGGAEYSMAMADAVNYALSNGVVVIVAMGNDQRALINYPAYYPGVIAVGSTNAKDEISSFSTTGNHISVSAPGDNIYSLSSTDNNGYVCLSGTSMATPFVSGLAALLLSNDGTLTPPEIKSILEDSAVDLGAAGFDPVFGYGRVDAQAAIILSKRNNFGAIDVLVRSNSNPMPGMYVQLRDSTGSSTVRAGLTSDGTYSGGTNGHFVFNFVRAGDYKVTVYYQFADAPATQTVDVSLSAGSTENIQIDFTVGAGWKTLLSEDFEGDVTASIFDGNGASYGEYYWAKSTYKKYAGTYSSWAVGGGANGSALAPGADYPNYASSWMIFGPFNTVGATDIIFTAQRYMYCETDFDYLRFLYSLNGTSFSGYGSSGSTGGWNAYTVPLSAANKTDILGKTQVWFAVYFSSDISYTYAEGAYVDDILIQVYKTY